MKKKRIFIVVIIILVGCSLGIMIMSKNNDKRIINNGNSGEKTETKNDNKKEDSTNKTSSTTTTTTTTKKTTETTKKSDSDKNTTIPEDYIAVFNGGSGEMTFSTYIYKIDNGQANSGFKYINTINTTVSYGSSEWNTKIKNQGEVNWTDEVFGVAKRHGAYSYVRLPNSDKTYTIEEFMDMFIMN